MEGSSTDPPVKNDTELHHKDQQVTVFAADGDIALLLDLDPRSGTYKQRFVVSSHLMAEASAVWEAMFSGRFKEGVSTKEIPWPEDNYHVLEVLLYMVHSGIGKTDRRLPNLEDMAIICDKYDVVHLCRARVVSWASTVKGMWKEDAPLRDRGRAIYIAYAFGLRRQFKNWVQATAKRASIETLLTGTNEDIEMFPSGVMEHIQRIVYATRAGIVKALIQGRTKADEEYCRFNRSPNKELRDSATECRVACDRTHLLKLQEFGIVPSDLAAAYAEDRLESYLYNLLPDTLLRMQRGILDFSIRPFIPSFRRTRLQSQHASCYTWRAMNVVRTRLRDWAPVPAEHQEHFKRLEGKYERRLIQLPADASSS